MVWCFDPLGTVQEPRDLSTGPPGKATNMGRPRRNGCMFIQKRVGFLLNKEANFNDSMILMVCFRDLYIFFQQKTPPERFVSLSSFISIKIFQKPIRNWAPNNPIFSISPPCNLCKKGMDGFLGFLDGNLLLHQLSHILSELLPMLR